MSDVEVDAQKVMDGYEEEATALRKYYGLIVTFSDESEICGEETNRTPTIFAEVKTGSGGNYVSSHLTSGAILYQGPARELTAWSRGLGWGVAIGGGMRT